MAIYETQILQKGTSDSTNEIINLKFEYCADFDGDGFKDVRVTAALDPASNSGTEDLVGIAFELNDANVKIGNIQKLIFTTPSGGVDAYEPSYVIDQNRVSSKGQYTDPGFNTTGGLLEIYDAGVKFSGVGSGDGIVQSASFLLTSTGRDIDAEALLDNTDWMVRLQSTDGGDGSSKMALLDLDLPPCLDDPPPTEDGMAQSPGFWKNHLILWPSEYSSQDNFELTFGITKNYDFSAKLLGDQSTLLDALSAGGSGVNGLARAGTAALLNAAIDPVTGVNYIYTDAESLAFGLDKVFGAGVWTSDDKASITATLSAIDINTDGRIQSAEIINAVDGLLDVLTPSWSDMNSLAKAFDVMNNMPHLDSSQFPV